VRDVNVCFAIPLYEHGSEVAAVLRALAPHGLPCIVVDDGSGPTTRRALDDLEAALPFVHVHHHKENRGKGGALQTAYRLAAARGFSHALQLDADGQHDAADVPRFLEAMRGRPEALVLGAPVFDDSVPRSRLWGRQLSRGLVWASTLSFAVRDPLCGFRGIPLGPTLSLLDRVRMGERMDFDPELAVRLVWEGVPVVSVATRVVYPEGGLSHFDVVWDDVRLAWLYARLLAGLVPRAPRMLRRRRARAS
jgi:glycosyltransferase involved in cell wall biosynthesis